MGETVWHCSLDEVCQVTRQRKKHTNQKDKINFFKR